MLPTWIMSKVNEYEIDMNGSSVKVRVIDREELLERGIAELQSKEPLFVGFDFKKREMEYSYRRENVLFLLHAENLCLIVQMQLFQSIPGSLKLFLANEDICFVGPDLDGEEFCRPQCGCDREEPKSNVELQCKTAVEPSFFAAMVLKNPRLIGSSLTRVGSEIGVVIDPSPPTTSFGWDRDVYGVSVKWDAQVFSHEEVKNVIQDVYGNYQIAKKLSTMI